jgi:hypothetical protein
MAAEAGAAALGGTWPEFVVPASFLGGNITVSWTTTQEVGNLAVTFFRTTEAKLDSEVSSQPLTKSPTIIALQANDPRVLGAKYVRVAPDKNAGANAGIEFRVDGSFVLSGSP